MFSGVNMSIDASGSAAAIVVRVLPLPLTTLPLPSSGPAVCAAGSELVSD